MEGDDRKTKVPHGASDDYELLLGRAELLLSAAEATRAKVSDTAGEPSWREAMGRMLSGAATLRSATSANAMALLEEARRERERIIVERDVLRGELELLRGERDLYLALAVDAGAAVARHLLRWRQLSAAPIDPTVRSDSLDGSGTVPRAESEEQAAYALAQSIDNPSLLAGTEITAGACDPVARLTLTVSAYPGVGALLDLERALAQLPSVRRCAVASVQMNEAQLDLLLRLPIAPLIIAAEILSLPGCPLAVAGVRTGHLTADFLVA